MIATLRQSALRLLRVPAEPAPPAGSHASVRVFRAARNFYWLLLIQWGLKQAGVLLGIVGTLMVVGSFTKDWHPMLALLVEAAEWIGLIGVVAQIPFTLALVRLDYELRWYIVTDRSLRIRAGIVKTREMTMTFANIQQISIRQGPLQRMLGIADLLVRSAGGGSGGESEPHKQGTGEMMHIGSFHGVDNAGEIRDLILDRMRRLRDSGLGDPDEPETADIRAVEPAENALLDAAHELRQEARSLRVALAVRQERAGS